MTQTVNPVAVITGAAGNLGQATARKFHALNYQLALLDRSTESLKSLSEELGNERVSTYAVDLINPESVQGVVKRICDDLGHIEVLANIAGGFTMGPLIQDTQNRDWDFMFDLNARSVFHMCREVLPVMLANQASGRIINVSARAALNGKAKMGPYCASKSAVLTLTESLAAENWSNDINVNCILPGTIDTPQNRADMPNADFSSWVAPSQLADVVAFLASADASAVNGAAIPVFGKS